MKYILHSIFDDKTEIFNLPFASITEMDAVRTFSALVNDPQTAVNRFPGDYLLYKVGYYDDHTGGYETFLPLFVTRGSSLINTISSSEDTPCNP